MVVVVRVVVVVIAVDVVAAAVDAEAAAECYPHPSPTVDLRYCCLLSQYCQPLPNPNSMDHGSELNY